MLIAGGHNINACCIDAAVAQDIRKLGDILLRRIVDLCK
jgi:hypothetical protein